MKAIVAKRLASDFSALELQERDIPKPGPGQVRVKMLMAAVNPSDSNFIHGDYLEALERLVWNKDQAQVCFDPARAQPYPELPYILGGEGVGIVDACGAGLMARRLMGKRVAISAGPPSGTWQEYTLVDAKKAFTVPDSMSDEQAAMYTINPLSSYIMVRKVLRAQKGQWLLQSAGASALGQSVIRMAKEYGYRTINIIRNPEQREALMALGADAVIVAGEEDIVQRVAAITQGKGVPCAMDCIGGPQAGDMVRSLGLGGKLVVYGTLANEPLQLPSRDLMMPNTSIEGFFAGSWLGRQSMVSLLSCVRQVSKLAQKGVFESKVAEVYDMPDFLSALEAATQAGKPGKVLLKIASTQ